MASRLRCASSRVQKRPKTEAAISRNIPRNWVVRDEALAEIAQHFPKNREQLERVRAITFDNRLERLMAGATGVVAMGGYNTFCEILTFDKPAVLVPRRHPRAEQYIRTARAEHLGLVRMLSDVDGRQPQRMVDALQALPAQQKPSDAIMPGLLDGLDRIHDLTELWLNEAPAPRRFALA